MATAPPSQCQHSFVGNEEMAGEANGGLRHEGGIGKHFGDRGAAGGAFCPSGRPGGPRSRNQQKRQRFFHPIGEPFSTPKRPNLARRRPKGSKVVSRALPDGVSDFGRLFGAALGGAMCSKYSTGYIQTTFRHLPKSYFLAPFWAPFWSLWTTLGAHVGHLGRQRSEKGGSKGQSKKRSAKRSCGEMRGIARLGEIGP